MVCLLRCSVSPLVPDLPLAFMCIRLTKVLGDVVDEDQNLMVSFPLPSSEGRWTRSAMQPSLVLCHQRGKVKTNPSQYKNRRSCASLTTHRSPASRLSPVMALQAMIVQRCVLMLSS